MAAVLTTPVSTSMHPSSHVLARAMPWLILVLLAAFPLLAPLFGMEFYIGFVRRVLIFAIACASLNFILGYGGIAVLGHAGFVGVGAYTLVALMDAGVVSAWVLWPAAMVVAGAFGLLIGSIALRTRGVYLIMSTLAFAQMLYLLAVSLRKYGGDDGYTMMDRPTFGFGLSSANNDLFYWVVLALFALVMLLLNRATRSRLGHALMGIRDNEVRMQALGYPVFNLKLAAYAGAAALAGLAGALLATHNAFVSPSIMHWTQSASLVVMVLIGGAGMRYGGPVGAAVWLSLEEIARIYTEYWHWPLGAVLLLVAFLAPRGLTGLRWRVRAKAAAQPAKANAPAGEGA